MKTLGLFALAGMAILPAAASAQTVVTRPGAGVHGGTMIPHHRSGHAFRRFQRGYVMPSFWFGPQFYIQDWRRYDFPEPRRGQRWIRHYDDAYLIDGDGRVRDHRYGLDWDQYGEEWTMEDGIPAYYGRGDFRPGDRDYEWAERHRRPDLDEEHAWRDGHDGGMEHHAYRREGHGRGVACRPEHPCGAGPVSRTIVHGGGGHPMPAPMPYPGYGYGYGYGYAYPIIIETTVTSGGACCVTETVEEVVEVRRAQPRRVRRAPPPAPRRMRPPPGERG